MKKEKILSFFKKYYIVFIIVAVSILLDQITKLIASNNLEYVVNDSGRLVYSKSVVIIEGFFSFTYARNTGAGWSILSGEMLTLILITIVSLAIFIYLLKI